MTYGRLSKPRFFMDNPNWLFSRGLSRSSSIDINSGAGFDDLNTGYTKYQMFDMDPTNYSSFDTNGGGDTVSITIDYSISAMPTNFLCIMNHNLKTAAGKIRIAHSSSPITTVGGGTSVASITEVLNGPISVGVATPTTDGDTLVTFDLNSDRYWAIELYDVSTWAADLKIGEIVLGEYYTMPISPDIATTKGNTYEGVTVNKSVGGMSFGSASWVAANTANYTAFRTDTYLRKLAGRETFDFQVPYIDDTDIYPADRALPRNSTNLLHDVINKSAMNLLPFIFLADSTSTTEGDFMYSRFDQNLFTSTRVAWGVESFSMRVIQEF